MAEGCEVEGNIPTWEKVDYKLQTKEFFAIVKKLNNKGLNLKTHITSQHVTNVDIMEVFGESKNLRTTNPTLSPTTKLELLRLYSKSYGHNNVTNNEFYMWFVKGYIIQEKGLNIDWHQ